MAKRSIRTTVDIPADLYRLVKAHAAERGCSARELILIGIRKALPNAARVQPKRVQFPLIKSDGPKVDLSNEQIYDGVEFP